jgi:hypothetical protein
MGNTILGVRMGPNDQGRKDSFLAHNPSATEINQFLRAPRRYIAPIHEYFCAPGTSNVASLCPRHRQSRESPAISYFGTEVVSVATTRGNDSGAGRKMHDFEG